MANIHDVGTNSETTTSHESNTELRRIDKIKRPPNSFMIYCAENRARLKLAYPMSGNLDISRLLGQEWKNAAPSLREHYSQKARVEKEAHLERFPNYKFVKRRTQDIKRRITASRSREQ